MAPIDFGCFSVNAPSTSFDTIASDIYMFILIASLSSLKVGAVFDHFGYPAPRLDEWQQRTWYDLGAAQGLLQSMRSWLVRGCPAIAGPIVPATLASTSDLNVPPARSSIGNKAPRTLAGQLQVARAVSTSTSSTSQGGNVSCKGQKKGQKKRKRKDTSVPSESGDFGPLSPKQRKEEEEKPGTSTESITSSPDGPFTNRDSNATDSAPEGQACAPEI